jgi:hypothetical protein
MRRLLESSAGLLALLGLLAFAEPKALAGDRQGDTIHLFNGKDLTNFYTWLGAPAKGQKPYGKNNDPEKVFTVQEGVIRVSGKVFGGLITKKEYENYHLVVEYRWGEKTWPPREHGARDSGVLLHCVGEDGAAGGVWMESIECQMIEGGTGDFILVGGKNRPSCTAMAVEPELGPGDKPQGYYYHPSAPLVNFTTGRINWFGRDPKWKDVKGFRGRWDVEKKIGEWNRLECVCRGNKITNILNGVTVNEIRDTSLTKGKILLQSEGAEVYFRKVDLQPLKKE